jgi:2-polyprenyl-6-methoxyphenol hydroxylase-like FAD-dependent oxidoreductase
MMQTRQRVVIVGAGPVGLALAGDLGWRGISCLLIERSDGAVFQPKMDLVGVRSMEFCRRWGIVKDVEGAGYNRDYPQDYAWVSALHGGWEFGREPFPSPAAESCPPESPQKRERCPQHFFDPVLTRFARRHPHVEIRYQTELVGFAEDAEGLTLDLVDHRDGSRYQESCGWMVGCDGGQSTVRQLLGIGMQGSPVLTYTTNAIIECAGLERLHDKAPGYRYIFIGPQGTWSTLVAINGRDWWRFSVVGDQTRRALDEEEISRLFCQAVGRRDFDYRILSVMPWLRRQLVADSYGRGRVYLAGDSVHLTSPTGGFGMNTGLQDAVDLSWKLAGTINGWGGPGLLASYGPERRPVAIRNIEEATGNLNRMLSPRDQRPPPEAFEPGAAGEDARRRFGDAYTAMMKREWFTIGIHLGYRYEGSQIIVPDGTPEPADTVSTYTQTARPGHRAPHVWIAPGRSTLDLFGRGFTLLRFAGAPSASALAEAAAARGVPLEVIDIDHAAAAPVYERRLVLVRPDGHVAWRGDAIPADPLALFDTVRGASPR